MLGRRLITVSAVLVALPLVVVTAPVWLVVGTIVDLVRGLRRLPTVRLGIFAAVYLAHEWAGLAASIYLGLRDRLIGWRWSRARRVEPYRRVQGWWARSLLAWARRLLRVRIETPDPATLPSGPFIFISRHASMVDAILPITLVVDGIDRFIHYVLKRELEWVPNIDVYGNRLGNYFVARDGDDEAIEIARFADNAFADSALVIFPEGTYATPASRARVAASLERRGDHDLLALAVELDHLLPPKPAGTLALLDTQPDHDVVILGHVGLEGVAQLGGLRRRLPLEQPVVVSWWVHPRAEIPTTEDGRVAWLNDRWRTLDDWIGSVEAGRSDPDPWT